MGEGLYPKDRHPQGHPNLAFSLNNMGTIRCRETLPRRSHCTNKPALRRARAVPEALPERPPRAGPEPSNMAALHNSQGEYARAEPLFRHSLDMYEKLYPRETSPGPCPTGPEPEQPGHAVFDAGGLRQGRAPISQHRGNVPAPLPEGDYRTATPTWHQSLNSPGCCSIRRGTLRKRSPCTCALEVLTKPCTRRRSSPRATTSWP